MLTDITFREMSDVDFKKVSNQKLFYKYACFDIATKNIIPDKTFKFTNPLYFNDPFDCNEQLLNINVEKSAIIDYVKNSQYKFNRNQRRKITNHHEQYDYVKVLKTEKERFKICCFSTQKDNVLMWSHYADKHKGICLGFELPILCKDYSIYPVNYISKIERIHGMVSMAYVFNYWLTRKSSYWKYESEVRAISIDKPDLINFEQGLLKEVIFGCKVKKKEIEFIKKLMKMNNYKKVKFMVMEIDRSTFDLKCVALN